MRTVSVIIPTHNLAASVGKAIESALAQTHTDLEIVVVDDGSTDDTEKVVSHYRTRILYLKQERRGVAAARNRGIRISRGEYIAFLDADDLWLPEKLEEQVPYLDQNPETSLVCSDWSLISDQGSVEPSVLANRNHIGTGYVFRQIVKSSFILTSTVVARRSCLEEAGLFDESFPTAEDLDLWLKISHSHNIALVRKPLVIKRSRPDGLSADPRLAATFRIKLFQKALTSLPDLSFSNRRLIRSILSRNYFDLGYIDFVEAFQKEARKNFLCSLRHDWTNGRALRCLATSYLPASVVRAGRALKRAVLE
jgi:glycosyltransferase involved in cell wall biosynthesis